MSNTGRENRQTAPFSRCCVSFCQFLPSPSHPAWVSPLTSWMMTVIWNCKQNKPYSPQVIFWQWSCFKTWALLSPVSSQFSCTHFALSFSVQHRNDFVSGPSFISLFPCALTKSKSHSSPSYPTWLTAHLYFSNMCSSMTSVC